MASDYRAFAAAIGANALSPAAYLALTSFIANGFPAGLVQSDRFNAVMRQATVPAAALAKFVDDNTPGDVLDNGDVNALATLIQTAVDKRIEDWFTTNVIHPAPGGPGVIRFPGSVHLMIQWGAYDADIAAGATQAVTFLRSFDVAPGVVMLTPLNPTGDVTADAWPELISTSSTGFVVKNQSTGTGGGSNVLHGVSFLAIGDRTAAI